MKYLESLKHWTTYFFAFWIEIATTRAQLYFCLRRKDYGCILGNLFIVVWWVFVVSVLRFFYLRPRANKQSKKAENPNRNEG